MVHSLNKGKRWERECANMLTLRTHKRWQRVPQSGATGTTNNLQNTSWHGDVFSEAYPDVIVECKSVRKLTLECVTSSNSRFWEWIIKLSPINPKPWLLLIKHTNRGVYAVTNRSSIVVDLLGNQYKRSMHMLGTDLLLLRIK